MCPRARRGQVVLVCVLCVLAAATGCTRSGGGLQAGGHRPAQASPSYSAPPTFAADPAKLPTTAAEAQELIAKVITGPVQLGPTAQQGTPYEPDTSRTPVLGKDCVWRLAGASSSVLAARTRRFVVPAAAGKGVAEVDVKVTVQRTVEDADWQQAEMLDEMLRCPSQQLTQDEWLKDLISVSLYRGSPGNVDVDDLLDESGTYSSAATGGPEVYYWEQARLGQTVLAITVHGGAGWTHADADNLIQDPMAEMLIRLEALTGKSGGAVGS